jgi:hypothetical protein
MNGLQYISSDTDADQSGFSGPQGAVGGRIIIYVGN